MKKLEEKKEKLLKEKEKLKNANDALHNFMFGEYSCDIEIGLIIWVFTFIIGFCSIGLWFKLLPVPAVIAVEALLVGWPFILALAGGVMSLNSKILSKKINKIERKLEILKSKTIEKTYDKELQIQANETIESLEQKQALIKQMIEQKRIQELKNLKQQQKELDNEIHKREQELEDYNELKV